MMISCRDSFMTIEHSGRKARGPLREGLFLSFRKVGSPRWRWVK